MKICSFSDVIELPELLLNRWMVPIWLTYFMNEPFYLPIYISTKEVLLIRLTVVESINWLLAGRGPNCSCYYLLGLLLFQQCNARYSLVEIIFWHCNLQGPLIKISIQLKFPTGPGLSDE